MKIYITTKTLIETALAHLKWQQKQEEAVEDALEIGWSYAKVRKALTDGVAFKKTNYYEVISHEGEFLCNIPLQMVESTVAWMRREKGINPGGFRIMCDFPRDHHRYMPVNFTYAWDDRV